MVTSDASTTASACFITAESAVRRQVERRGIHGAVTNAASMGELRR
jgi:hypothetical protein